MHRFFKNNNKGFTLVETLVAVSIFTVSILGLISVLASGISDIGYAKKKIAATYLAQEGIEYTRNFRDNSVIFNINGVDVGGENLRTISLVIYCHSPKMLVLDAQLT